MNDFARQKIAFSVAFLAALISISPLLLQVGGRGFPIYGVFLTISHLYYATACVFTLSVYAFGIQFFTEKGINSAAKLGNILYALALVLPALYLALFITTTLLSYISKALNNIPIGVISGIIGVAFGAAGAWFVTVIQRRLAERDADATSDQLSREETMFMKRSQDLMRSRQYDLAIVEAFKAIEVSARKALHEKGIYFQQKNWISTISTSQILPNELVQGLHRIRQIRNMAAHGIEPISAETAREFLPLAARIVATLSSQQDVT